MKQILIENNRDSIIDRGWGNGYVLIPKHHPYWGKHYEDIPVTVHGGLTFGAHITNEKLDWFDELTKEDIGYYMVGFDTAHYGDDTYTCPKEYVIKETQSLHDQLKELNLTEKNLNIWKKKNG